MRNGRKLWGTEKVKRLRYFAPFRGKQLQRVYELVKFLELENNRNVDNSKLSIETLKSRMKQVKVEGVVISNALGLD